MRIIRVPTSFSMPLVSMPLVSIALVVASLCARTAAAELHECDGKWTNLPCNGAVERSLSDSTRISRMKPGVAKSDSDPADAGAAETSTAPLAPRSELARKLRRQSDEYKAKGGVALTSVELDTFRRYCEEKTRTVGECQQRFTEESQRLTELNQTKEKLSLDEERNQIESEKLRAIGRR